MAPPPAARPPVPSLPALAHTQPLAYLSGGAQTDVYLTADKRFTLKLKLIRGHARAAYARAAELQRFADSVCGHLGPEYSLPTWFLVLANDAGEPLIIGVQPFLAGAHPLDALGADALSQGREPILAQLRTIVARSLAYYRATGRVADLYGYGRRAGAVARHGDPLSLLAEGWRLLSQRPLLSAHNLMLTTDGRVVLVDYDLICRGCLCGMVYGARAILLLRDRWQLAARPGRPS